MIAARAPEDYQAINLTTLARAVRDLDVDALAETLRIACLRGAGHWQGPAPGGPIGRPATHLFEISLFGVIGTGTTPQEAAHNWRHCALTQIDSPA